MNIKFHYDQDVNLDEFGDYTFFDGRHSSRGLNGISHTIPIDRLEFPTIEEAEAYIGRDYIFVPVYKYDHSAVAYSATPFSCPWDSGQIGWLGVAKDKAREWHSKTRLNKRINDLVINELTNFLSNTLTQYHNGEVYWAERIDDENEPCIGPLFGESGAVEGAMYNFGCTREEAEQAWNEFIN